MYSIPIYFLKIILICTCILVTHSAFSQFLDLDDRAFKKLKNIDVELSLNNGDLKLVNIYKIQVLILHELAGRPQNEIVNRLVKEVYEPYQNFWQGYIGSESDFTEWVATTLLDSSHPIYKSIQKVIEIDINDPFENTVKRFTRLSNKSPKGTWYIVFGPGWTDMGGMGDGAMVIDYSNLSPSLEYILLHLPHELNHQTYVKKPQDPDENTVLYRMINEGFATYLNYKYWDNQYSPAQVLVYSEDEWLWGIANEEKTYTKAKTYLYSNKRSDVNAFASRNSKLFTDGPSALGYFIGFRICQAYVEKHGEQAWKEIYHLPVRKVLELSGYGQPNKAEL